MPLADDAAYAIDIAAAYYYISYDYMPLSAADTLDITPCAIRYILLIR